MLTPDIDAAFALDPALTLLNHGSFGACPRRVLAVQDLERARLEADPIGFMDEAAARVRVVADRVAVRLGARGDDLALVENATAGTATVLRSLALAPGDRLVTTSHVYGAVRQALQVIGGRAGAVVDEVVVPFPLSDPEEVVAAVVPHVRGARLAVLDWITSPTGLVLPVEPLVAACRAEGVPVLLDAAHAPGQVPMDLDALGADWVTGNLHKWLFAPKGSAVLWARADRRGELVPLAPSHDTPLGFPRAFDWVGTRDPSGWLAVPEALAFVDALGLDAIRAHNDALAAWAAQTLADRWGVVLPAPASMRAAMATLPLPGDVPAERVDALHDALRARGLEVMLVPFDGRAWIRISAQVYNTEAEYLRLGEAVVDLLA